MAFMNSVVFGTRANSVTPRSFSGIPEPSKTTSTTSTKISKPPQNQLRFSEREEGGLTSDDSVENSTTHENTSTLDSTPIRRIMSPSSIFLLFSSNLLRRRSRMLSRMRCRPNQCWWRNGRRSYNCRTMMGDIFMRGM